MDIPFWNAVISNAVFASLLAAVALAIRKWLTNPRLEHFVWVLVFIKLFTPPLANLNFAWPSVETTAADVASFAPPIIASQDFVAQVPPAESTFSTSTMAIAAWLLGSLMVLLAYACGSWKFGRVLKSASPAESSLQIQAHKLAQQLRVRRKFQVLTVDQPISPLACWNGWQLTIVLPTRLIKRLQPEATQAILAHELAHIKRRDHLVRLLEAIATIVFWWHPVAWLAKRRLQECGELCCDAHVIASTESQPKQYATALLETVDWLAGRPLNATWSVTAATGNSHTLTRRFKMLQLQTRRTRSTMIVSLGLALLATASLGLGVAVGQETKKDSPPQGEKIPAEKTWTLDFEIKETDADGIETKIACPKIITASDASLKVEGNGRLIEVQAEPLANTNPQQWKIQFKYKDQGKHVAAPSIIVVNAGYVTIGQVGGSSLTFDVSVK